jgi:hypothetical protein
MELDGPSRSHEPLAPLGVPRFSSGRSGSGSLAYPTSLMAFVPLPARASRVFPSRPPSSAEASERRPSWPYPLLQSAHRSAGTASRWFLLSWDSVFPSRRHTFRVSTPGSRGPLRTDVAKRRFMFRPRGFAPPQRFSPRESYGSVAPRNRPRVRRVSCVPPPHRPKTGKRRDNSRDAVHTLRRFPLISSRTASLRPLPSCRYRPARRGRRHEPVSLPTASPTEVGERTPVLTLPGVIDRPCPRRGVGDRFPD